MLLLNPPILLAASSRLLMPRSEIHNSKHFLLTFPGNCRSRLTVYGQTYQAGAYLISLVQTRIDLTLFIVIPLCI